MIFCRISSVCKAIQKWKIVIKKNYYVILSFLLTFVKQNKKQKWDEKLINENVMFRSDLSFANLECQEVIRNV